MNIAAFLNTMKIACNFLINYHSKASIYLEDAVYQKIKRAFMSLVTIEVEPLSAIIMNEK